jgi:excisionase family DNA binding protein
MMRAAASEPLLLDLPAAAELLSISRSRAYEMAHEGTMPGLIKLGSTWRVSRSRLEGWIAEQLQATAATPAPEPVNEKTTGQAIPAVGSPAECEPRRSRPLGARAGSPAPSGGPDR